MSYLSELLKEILLSNIELVSPIDAITVSWNLTGWAHAKAHVLSKFKDLATETPTAVWGSITTWLIWNVFLISSITWKELENKWNHIRSESWCQSRRISRIKYT